MKLKIQIASGPDCVSGDFTGDNFKGHGVDEHRTAYTINNVEDKTLAVAACEKFNSAVQMAIQDLCESVGLSYSDGARSVDLLLGGDGVAAQFGPVARVYDN